MFFKNNNKIKNQNINQNLTTIHIQKTCPLLLERLPIDKSIMLKKNNYVFCNNDIFSEDSASDFHDTLPEIPEVPELINTHKENIIYHNIKNLIFNKISYIKSFFIFIYNYIIRFFVRINFFKYLPQIIK